MQFEWNQSLVAINPATLIAQICNLFIQLFIIKKFFLDKIKAVLDARRTAADQEITTAEAAKAEALAIKETYEKNMQVAKAQANEIMDRAQKTATVRGEEIIRQATEEAAHIKQKAASDIALEKKKAINDAKNEISGVAMAIAEKVVERQLDSSDHDKLINQFIDQLGE